APRSLPGPAARPIPSTKLRWHRSPPATPRPIDRAAAVEPAQERWRRVSDAGAAGHSKEWAMRATCWYGAGDVRTCEVPEPEIVNPRDAIIRITLTAICGSDLHLYDGFIPTMKRGDILGHEFMGEV